MYFIVYFEEFEEAVDSLVYFVASTFLNKIKYIRMNIFLFINIFQFFFLLSIHVEINANI